MSGSVRGCGVSVRWLVVGAGAATSRPRGPGVGAATPHAKDEGNWLGWGGAEWGGGGRWRCLVRGCGERAGISDGKSVEGGVEREGAR